MKLFPLLFCLVFVCCYQDFQDHVEIYDFDGDGEYILSNGEQDIVLAEKCYYYGKGEYECGLTAVGVTDSTSCVTRSEFSRSGHVSRYHLKAMDFSKVMVKAKDGSTHGLLSYSSDRMFAYDDGKTFYSTFSEQCVKHTIFFDAIDLIQGQTYLKNDLLLMKSDSLGVVEMDITDSEYNNVHLVYRVESPKIMDSLVFEKGGFYIDPKEIKLLLDYCDFTIDSAFVSDSLLQECLENCFFCDGVLPMINRRDVHVFYDVHGYHMEKGKLDADNSYFYDAKQDKKSIGLWPGAVSAIGVRNIVVQVPELDVPFVYYKPK